MRHISLRVLICGVCLFLVPPQGLSAQQGGKLRVAIVADGPWEHNAEFRNLLEREIQEVFGKDSPLVFPSEAFLVGDWTLQGAHAINDRLLADPSVDVILGFGLIVSHDLCTRGPLPKPVIAPIVIDVERQGIPMKNGTSGVRNLNYLVYPTTFERDIELFKEIVPIKKLINITSRRYFQALPPPHITIADIGKKLGLEITQLFVDVSAAEVLNALPKEADAVYLEPTLQLPSAEFAKLVQGFIERRLPSFSFFGESEVRQGIMASANPDVLPRLIRRVALNLRRILDGEEPGSLSVAFTPGKRLSINLGTAYAVGVSPKWSVLLEAELIGIDTTAPGAARLSFPEAIRRFSEQNLDVQARVRAVDAEATNLTTARSALLPRIDIGATGLQIDKDRAQAGGQPERSASVDVTASQVILSEPALANVSIQSSLQESREQDLEVTRLNTILEGATYYINSLRTQRLFYILLDNLKLTRTNLELARVRQTTGVAGPEETLRWEVEIANLRRSAMDVQGKMNQAFLALKQVLNIPLVYQINLADISLDDTALFTYSKELLSYLEDPVSFGLLNDFLVNEARHVSPELRQLDVLIDAQQRSLTSLRLSYVLPTISAFGSFSNRVYKSSIVSPFQLPPLSAAPPPATPVEQYLYNVLGSISVPLPDDRDWSVGVQLSLNLFNGFSTRAAEERAAIHLEEYHIQRAAAEEKVALGIRVEMEKAKSSYFAIQQAEHEQSAARKTLDIVTEAYSRGAVSILSLLDAQASALRGNQVVANALYDFLIDYMSLQRAVGQFDLLMAPEERQDFLRKAREFVAKARGR
jgi:outer membrane protein